MKDEIKEILESLDKIAKAEYYPEDLLSYKECQLLLDCITNLQEKLKVSQTNEETYRLEMQDITKILGLDEHTTFDEVKEYATNLQEENKHLNDLLDNDLNEKEQLEQRIDKANEYMNNNPVGSYIELRNIINGDKDE